MFHLHKKQLADSTTSRNLVNSCLDGIIWQFQIRFLKKGQYHLLQLSNNIQNYEAEYKFENTLTAKIIIFTFENILLNSLIL